MTSISRSQRSSRRECQVLVVGAGPTGLVLACELLARGVRARIIDKGDGVVLQTRALGIHARALEVFDMMGLAGRFTERGQVVRRFHMYADGKTLVRLDLARNGSAFGFMLDVAQDVTETILAGGSASWAAASSRGPSSAASARTPAASPPRSPRREALCGPSPLTTWSAPMAPIAVSAPSSAWTSAGTRTRRTGCSPTSTWTGTVPTTRCTRSSGATAGR